MSRGGRVTSATTPIKTNKQPTFATWTLVGANDSLAATPSDDNAGSPTQPRDYRSSWNATFTARRRCLLAAVTNDKDGRLSGHDASEAHRVTARHPVRRLNCEKDRERMRHAFSERGKGPLQPCADQRRHVDLDTP